MQTTQHNNRCPVYLHPAAASNRKAIAAIQSRTGLLVIFQPKNATAQAERRAEITDHLDPWGGDAA